jgi:hypothetical protein
MPRQFRHLGVFAPLVGALVFKTSGRLEESRQWVRFPYTPVFFIKAQAVRQNRDGTFTVEIPSQTAVEDAAIQGLCPPQHGGTGGFVQRNEWPRGSDQECGGAFGGRPTGEQATGRD